MADRRGFIKNAAKIGLGSQLLFNTPLELVVREWDGVTWHQY